MNPYAKREKGPAYFAQGFRLGFVFGVLGAVVMLGRRGATPETTL